MKSSIAALLALALNGPSAIAWETTVEGPDVFGKTTGVAVEFNGDKSMVVQCDSDDKLFVAFILRKKQFEEVIDIPAKLFIKTTDDHL